MKEYIEERAVEIAERENTSLFNVMLSATEYPELARTAPRMFETALKFSEIMLQADEMTIPDFIQKVFDETGMLAAYEKEDSQIEDQARADNLREFLSVAKEYEQEQRNLGNDDITYAGFLEYVSLSSDADTKSAADDDNNKVTLMTIHSAKGLEFPVVFIVGTEDGIFPSYRSIEESPEAIDEERRLCYVAITRAMRKLYILNTEERMLYGKTTRNQPSRFLAELPASCVQGINQKPQNRFSQGRGTPGFGSNFESRQYQQANSFLKKQFDAEEAYNKKLSVAAGISAAKGVASKSEEDGDKYLKDFDIGQRVKHKKFGVGTVSKILGDGMNKTLEIVFDECGMKRLIIAYAKLENP